MKRILILCTLFLHIGLMYGQRHSNVFESESNEAWDERWTIINNIKEKSEDIDGLQHQFFNEIAKGQWLLLERNNNGQYTIVDLFDIGSCRNYYGDSEDVMIYINEKGLYPEQLFNVKKYDVENYYMLITDVDFEKIVYSNMSHIDSLKSEMVKLCERLNCYGSMINNCKKKFENEEQKHVATEIVEKMRVTNHPKYKKANKDLIKGVISKVIYDSLKELHDSCLVSLYTIAQRVNPQINSQEPAYFFKDIYYDYVDYANRSSKHMEAVNQGVSYFITKEIPKIKEKTKSNILEYIYDNGNSSYYNQSYKRFNHEYFESKYEDVPFYIVGLVKVGNPYSCPKYRNTLYQIISISESHIDEEVQKLNEIDTEEQSKGFEWVYTSKSVEKKQDYPIPVTYFEFENHPEYRCIENHHHMSFLFNDQGELQRVTKLIRDRMSYQEIDNTFPRVPYVDNYDQKMRDFDELWRHVIKIAYDANKYNIKSKGTKTQKCINAYITPLGLSKAGEEAAKALGQSMFANVYYGENSNVAKRASRTAGHQILGALMEYYDADAMNWMAQIRQDYIKDFEMPYEIKRVDNTTFDVIYVDEDLKPKWKLTIKYYTVEPYVANRVTKLVEIK